MYNSYNVNSITESRVLIIDDYNVMCGFTQNHFDAAADILHLHIHNLYILSSNSKKDPNV